MLFRSKCSVKDKHSSFYEVYCFKKNSSRESTLIYSTQPHMGTSELSMAKSSDSGFFLP